MSALSEPAKEALQEYQNGNVHLTPLYPGILIRVLPKPLFHGSILLTGSARDRPLYEAIVIQTYAPHKVSYKGEELILESELKPGMHIIFPHWSGAPIAGLNDEEYRLIPDHSHFNTMKNDTGEPLMILSQDAPVRERMKIILNNYCIGGHDDAIRDLLRDFDIVAKGQRMILDSKDANG